MNQKKTKILLLTPLVLYSRQPSIGVAYLSSYLKREGYQVKVWDLNTEMLIPNDGDDYFWTQKENCASFFENNKPFFEQIVKKILEYGPQIVGFTVWSTTKFFSLELARMIKEADKDIAVVFGGYWCNIEEGELSQSPFVDALIKGEGETALLEIVRNYEATGRIVPGQRMCREITDLDSLPFPDFSDFQLEKYLFKYHIPLLFSRGCSWRCNFCTVFHSWRKFRKRSAENIFQEILSRIKEFPQLKQFELCDCAFNQDAVIVSKLCDMIISEGVQARFSGLSQIRPEMDFELLKKMKKAGFILCNFGIESGSGQVLKSMGKKFVPDAAERVIKDTFNAGIDVILNFVVGFPGETEENFNETLKFIEKIKDHVTNIAPGHECDIKHTYIHSNPGRFNVVVPESKDHVMFWETRDGKNNFSERERRKKIFNQFVSGLKIPIKCGVDDRKDRDGSAD